MLRYAAEGGWRTAFAVLTLVSVPNVWCSCTKVAHVCVMLVLLAMCSTLVQMPLLMLRTSLLVSRHALTVSFASLVCRKCN
jgi:hypothetical protein